MGKSVEILNPWTGRILNHKPIAIAIDHAGMPSRQSGKPPRSIARTISTMVVSPSPYTAISKQSLKENVSSCVEFMWAPPNIIAVWALPLQHGCDLKGCLELSRHDASSLPGLVLPSKYDHRLLYGKPVYFSVMISTFMLCRFNSAGQIQDS